MTVVLVWTTKRLNNNETRGRPLIDILLSKVKSLMVYCKPVLLHKMARLFASNRQIFGNTPDGSTCTSDSTYSLPFPAIASGCLWKPFYDDGNKWYYIVLLAFLFSFALFYRVRKVLILRSRSLQDNDKSKKSRRQKNLRSEIYFSCCMWFTRARVSRQQMSYQ